MADTILALLEPGEYVINSRAAKKIGKEALDEVNYDMMPRFANGGSILGEHLQGYQTGGPVSYGGYESELPNLESLYEQFGVEPNAENLKRFEEYDPSREGVYREDFATAMGGLQTTGQRGLEGIYGATRGGGGGFAGSGFGEAALTKARGSMMQDYLQGQRGAYSTMFKGIRGEREQWMKEMGSQLTTLEEAGGTYDYTADTSEGIGNDPNVGWPNQAAYDQWVSAGRPDNAAAYGFAGDGDPNLSPGGGGTGLPGGGYKGGIGGP
jgi:hypothetical protein